MTLKEARERLGKTQGDMAKMLGISRNYLALIETGKRNESADLVQRATELLASAKQELTASQWKARALQAESRLASLRKALASILEEY